MMANQMTIHDLCKPLASGRTAEVYDWKPGWVLKLFFAWSEPGIADYARRITAAICATGLPFPMVATSSALMGGWACSMKSVKVNP
jgi:hypothetical protein